MSESFGYDHGDDRQFEPQSNSGCFNVVLALIGLGLAVAVVVLLVVMVVRPLLEQAGGEANSAVGSLMPRVELVGLTGTDERSVTLAEISGKVTLLIFWGVWCPPCRLEIPHIAEIYADYSANDQVRVLAVSCPRGLKEDLDSLRAETEDFLRREGLSLPTYADPGQVTRLAFDRVQRFRGYPTKILLDRNGVIRKVWVGYQPGVEREMRQRIEELLSETSPKAVGK